MAKYAFMPVLEESIAVKPAEESGDEDILQAKGIVRTIWMMIPLFKSTCVKIWQYC